MSFSISFEKYSLMIGEQRDKIIDIPQISIIHERCKKKSIDMYQTEKKMRKAKNMEKFKKILEERIDLFYNE